MGSEGGQDYSGRQQQTRACSEERETRPGQEETTPGQHLGETTVDRLFFKLHPSSKPSKERQQEEENNKETVCSYSLLLWLFQSPGLEVLLELGGPFQQLGVCRLGGQADVGRDAEDDVDELGRRLDGRGSLLPELEEGL